MPSLGQSGGDHLPRLNGQENRGPWLWAERGYHFGFIVFVLVWALNLLLLGIPGSRLSHAQWPEALLVCAAAIVTILAVARRISPQNAIIITILILILVPACAALLHRAGLAPEYSAATGPNIFPGIPWFLPLVWLVLLLNTRGVARLALRRWRGSAVYGFWLIACAALLLAFFGLLLEPYAVRARQYWSWPTPAEPIPQFAATWFTAVVVQLFLVPWLIDKKPAQPPPDFHPLLVWLLLNVWLMLAVALHGLWRAAWAALAANIAIVLLALAGGRPRGGD